MPPETPAPSTPTSSSATPELVTRKFFNKYASSRCTVCKKDVSIGDEMEAEVRKRKTPGTGKMWLNKRHHPSCLTPTPVSDAPFPNALDFDGGGPDFGDDIGGGGGGGGSSQTNSSPPERMSRSSLGGPATSPSPVPSPSAQSLSPLTTSTVASASGAATRDVSTQTDSPPEEMPRVFGGGPVASSTPIPLPSTPLPSPPSTGAEAGMSGAGAAPAAAGRGYARGRGYAPRSGGSTSRNLAMTEGWTRGVFTASPDSKPTVAKQPASKNTGDDDGAESSMSPTSISLSAPLPASSPPAATWMPVSSSQPVTRGDHIDPGVTVSGVFRLRGQSFDNRIACRVGRKAKKMYNEERGVHAGERLTKRKPSGLAFPEYVYPSRDGGIVIQAFDSVMLSLMP